VNYIYSHTERRCGYYSDSGQKDDVKVTTFTKEEDGILDDKVIIWSEGVDALGYVDVKVQAPEEYDRIVVVFFDEDGKYIFKETVYLTFGSGDFLFVEQEDWRRVKSYKYKLS